MLLIPPSGTTDESDLTAVTLAMFGSERYRCPASDLMKARGMLPARKNRRRWERLNDFVSGLLMDRLDEIEFGTDLRSVRPVHEGVREWISYAIRAYLDACAKEDRNDPVLQPVSRWVYRYRLTNTMSGSGHTLIMTAWARCYSSADGQERELRLIANRLRRDREDSERAVAAMVAAEGLPGPRPRYVRVREVGLLEAKSHVIYEGDHDAAVAFYRSAGRPALQRILSADEYRPGSACVKCDFAAVCPKLPRADGLAGQTDRSRPRRSWSVTNGRDYAVCPARDYLCRQHLPTDDAIEYSADATRGRAIHEFLAQRHDTHLPCVPDIADDWVPQPYVLSDQDRKLGMRILRHHAEVCPLRHASASDIRVEQERVFEDRDSNVLVVAKPDLLYQDNGGWVWRELKSHRTSWHSRSGLLAENPQLALAVLITNRGDLGGVRERSRVELETLRPGGADLAVIDPCDQATVAEARRVIDAMIAPWHADDLFAARPGSHCARCAVARWCPSRTKPEAAA